MTKEQVAHLLERFYDGTSTREEELALSRYLASAECPPELEADRRVVAAMSAPTAALPEGLEARIAAAIRPPRRRRHRLRRLFTLAGALTAAAVIVVSLYVWRLPPSPTVYADTCATPQEAAVELHNTLMYVSNALNCGLNGEDELGGPCD